MDERAAILKGMELAAETLEAWATQGLSEETNSLLRSAATDLRKNAAFIVDQKCATSPKP